MHRRFAAALCLYVLSWIGSSLSFGADYLVISLDARGKDVHVDGTLGSETLGVDLEGKRKEILDRLDAMHDILENKSVKKLGALRADVAALSEQLIKPFAALLAKTEHVVFRIEKPFVGAPLDVLENGGKPLFLSHAVTYVISKFKLRTKAFPKLENGYFMADLTADPEQALKAVAATIPQAKYVKMEEGSLDSIRRGVKDANVFVLSAHGEVDKKGSGDVAINKEELDADFLKKLNVDLTYFDSCQTGSAWDFVETFAKSQTSTYYVAPIISNDAGDSSTRTVTWFFEGLKGGKGPAVALLETKRKLYEFYVGKKLDEITVLNKAAPFRLYEFDQK